MGADGSGRPAEGRCGRLSLDDDGDRRSAGRSGSSSLHGRRRGKRLAVYQQELIQTLLPRLAVDTSARIDPAALFGRQPREVWLEIGFGAGEHFVAAAMRHRDISFIGCEPFLNGMARALAHIASADLDNVRLYDGDAGEIIDALPDACLDRVLIYYPDPWPKRRQRKRRFISDGMLSQLARVMRPDAELRFATDIDDYSGWTLVRLMRSPDFVWLAEQASDWTVPWPDWIATRYERKAVGQGRQPCYITAMRRPLQTRTS